MADATVVEAVDEAGTVLSAAANDAAAAFQVLVDTTTAVGNGTPTAAQQAELIGAFAQLWLSGVRLAARTATAQSEVLAAVARS
jgi:hypothetical protein